MAQVAELIGTSQQNLASALKHGDIRTGLLEQISEALGLSLAEFYGDAFGTVQQATGSHNTQVAGSSNVISNDPELLALLRNKDEQLLMAMKQTSTAQVQTTKAQEQMDRVLEAFIDKDAGSYLARRPASHQAVIRAIQGRAKAIAKAHRDADDEGQ